PLGARASRSPGMESMPEQISVGLAWHPWRARRSRSQGKAACRTNYFPQQKNLLLPDPLRLRILRNHSEAPVRINLWKALCGCRHDRTGTLAAVTTRQGGNQVNHVPQGAKSDELEGINQEKLSPGPPSSRPRHFILRPDHGPRRPALDAQTNAGDQMVSPDRPGDAARRHRQQRLLPRPRNGEDHVAAR